MDIPITNVTVTEAVASIEGVEFSVVYVGLWPGSITNYRWNCFVVINGRKVEMPSFATTSREHTSTLHVLGLLAHRLATQQIVVDKWAIDEDDLDPEVLRWGASCAGPLMTLALCLYQHAALVFNEGDVPLDWCSNWQSAMHYAYTGRRVVAIRRTADVNLPMFQSDLNRARRTVTA